MIQYFRRYNKIIFWIVVAIILPLFAVTGVMMEVVGRPDLPPVGTIFGEEVKPEDFALEKRRLAQYLRVMGRDQGFNDEVAFEHLIMRKKADQAGIEVSDEELAERIRDIYAQLESYRRAALKLQAELKDERVQDDRQFEMRLRQLAQQERPHIEFDPERYAETIEERGTSPAEFEKALREEMRVERLRSLIAASSKATPERVWERYQDDAHRRQMRYVTFTADAFANVDPAKVTDEQLKRFYERNTDRFREPLRVAVEYVAAPLSTFDAQVKEPTEEEIAAQYESVKERYRLPPPPAPPTATAQAEPQYRPLADVRAEVVADMKTERKRELAKKAVETVRTQAVSDIAAGKQVDLEAAAKAAGLVYAKLPLQEPEKLLDDKLIANYLLLHLTGQRLKPGELSETSVNREAASFVRLIERKEERTPPFDEIVAKVRESYITPSEDEVQTYFQRNAVKYRDPERAVIEYVHVAYARFEKAVPETVTGTARQDELRRRAEEKIRAACDAAAGGEDGKPRDLESAALENAVDFATVTVEKTGKDLPPELRGSDIIGRLASGTDKEGAISPAFENEGKTGLYAYRVKERIPSKTPPLADIREKVLKDLLAERAAERARDAAEAMAKAVEGGAPLEPEAKKWGVEVVETGFLARGDEVPGVKASRQVLGRLFALQELGETAGPIVDNETKTSYVIRWTAREAADPAKFAEREAEIRREIKEQEKSLARFGIPPQSVREWEQMVLLEARGIGDEMLREIYALRYGEDGLASIEARHMYIAADKATIDAEMEKRAKARAEEILAKARAGEKFSDLARRWSDDEKTRERGGNLGTFGRGKMVKPFEDAVFAAKPGDIVGPVKTEFGYHVIRVEERRGEDVRARHILFRTERRKDPATGELEPLDPEVRKAALAAVREKAEKAKARLDAGEDFAAVAKDVSEEPGAAEKRDYQYHTPFERSVFAAKPQEVTGPLEGAGGAHLVLTASFRGDDRRGRVESGSVTVRHIFVKGQGAADRALRLKDEIQRAKREAELGDTRAGWSALLKAFEEHAKKASQALSSARGGEIGVFEPDPDFAKYGPAFRDALYALGEGETSGIVESREGLSIIHVVSKKKKTFEEAKMEIAESLLQGISF